MMIHSWPVPSLSPKPSLSSTASTASSISSTTLDELPDNADFKNASPTSNKTHAFFASPFSTSQPSPTPSPTSFAFPTRATPPPFLSHPTPVSSRPPSPDATPRPPSLLAPSFTFPSLPYDPLLTIPEKLQKGIRITSLHTNPPLDLELTERLGVGAFSSVWCAEDRTRALARGASIRRSASLRSAKSGRSVSSTSARSVDFSSNQADDVISFPTNPPRLSNKNSHPQLGSTTASLPRPRKRTKLVAVKLTTRVPAGRERDRTRAAFIREVEILKHIAHPNITPLLAALSTPTHHMLVLPMLSGGDLLSLLNSDSAHAALRESDLKSMLSGLVRAVSWMHQVGLVHRDIKLENTLLTAPFPPTLPDLPAPTVQLADFGLARFIDPENPYLTTRCGSEAYAAPELVIGGGKYDGRKTDAWAVGVVMYGLVCRKLPFGEGARGDGRRRWLMGIARGYFEWPFVLPRTAAQELKAGELSGRELVNCEGVRRLVGRLLVRDEKNRANLGDLLGDPWFGEEGSIGSEMTETSTESPSRRAASWKDGKATRGKSPLRLVVPSGSDAETLIVESPLDVVERHLARDLIEFSAELEGDEEDERWDDGGWEGMLVEEDAIDGIARGEVL